MKKIIILLTAIQISLLVGCASSGVDDVDVPLADDAFTLYEKSQEGISIGNYQTAIKMLEQLDSLYPFGPYSHQAQLALIYSYYKTNDVASTITAADRFIRQNPNHPNLDYVYYMKGLVNFTAETGFFQELLSADLAQRDASSARQSFTDFSELLQKFPNSEYAKDARQRMIYLRDRLSKYELHVARFYMERKAYIAAANRAQYIIENYPTTSSVPEALGVMVTAYDILKLDDLSEKAKRTLKLNYPEYAARIE
jgi:outer membrane protein assembly factor BamD